MSSTPRKRRADSPLTRQPKAAREKILDLLNRVTYAEAVPLLKRDFGISTSPASLSGFYASESFRRSLEQARDLAMTVVGETESLRQLDDAAKAAVARKIFDLAVDRAASPQDLARLATIQQRDKTIALEERRLVLLEKKAEQASQAEQIVQSADTPEEKQQKLRAIFGMS
jgi:hypothetical protein